MAHALLIALFIVIIISYCVWQRRMTVDTVGPADYITSITLDYYSYQQVVVIFFFAFNYKTKRYVFIFLR